MPKSEAIKDAKSGKGILLRPSEHPEYSDAYISLGTEICDFVSSGNQVSDIFICCSSGIATIGMIKGMSQRNIKLPVHIVQTSHVNTIAKDFDQDFSPEKVTLANAISDKVAKRKLDVISQLELCGGSGLVADNQLILKPSGILNSIVSKENQFTGNAALSLAGYLKAIRHNTQIRNPLIIISGN